MMSLYKLDKKGREGYFRSYRDIGEYLVAHGQTGTYYAIPSGIKSIAGMRKITVNRYGPDEEDVDIEMDGSHY